MSPQIKKIWNNILIGCLLLLLFIPYQLLGVEIRLTSEPKNPQTGTYFEVSVIAGEVKQVLGVDLRLQFDSQIVGLEKISAKKLTQFQWFRSQMDSLLGYAMTAIMLNQNIDLENNDTLAVATFLRLGENGTTISLKSGYPILINKDRIPISCNVLPVVLDEITSVKYQNNDLVPTSMSITNYPNPFNASTQFVFINDNRAQKVNVQVFNILGRLVWQKDIIAGKGENSISWNGVNFNKNLLPSGVYIYRFKVNQKVRQGKCVIIR